MKMLTATPGMAPSHLSDKMASRNGPRRSVYWVQCRRTTTTTASDAKRTSSTADMAAGTGRVEYAVTGKYTGEWKDGLKHGYGVYVYSNGSKFEGEWAEDQRHGKGTYWVNEKHDKLSKTEPKARKQYAGEWREDKRHGMGTFFFEDGGRYDGLWEKNKREGTGRMVYADHSVYEGQWHKNQRSGHGVLVLPNGDRYEGHWLNDKKEGPGRFYYKATRKMYEGEWVDDAPRCGTYYDNEEDDENEFDDPTKSDAKVPDSFEIPELGLAHPERVVSESIAYIRQERLMEKAFQAHQVGTVEGDESTDFKDPNDAEYDADGGDVGGSVVFDEATMKLLQHEFQSVERRDGTIPCESLPHVMSTLGLIIANDHILAFLDEIGATPETAITFAECVDIISLLAESAVEYARHHDQDNTVEEEDEDGEDEDED